MMTFKQTMQRIAKSPRILEVFHTIQAGSSPMSKYEIQKLIDLRPEVYGCLTPYVK